MTLYMMKGLPASGKTTRAKELCHETHAKRVNKDDLRSMLDDGVWGASNEKFVLQVRDAIVENALKEGRDVVVDDTNLKPSHETDLREIASRFGANFQIVDLTSVPLETCLQRDLLRPKQVGADVIKAMHKKWLSGKRQPKRLFSPLPARAYDPMLPDCIIVDIDGTVALHGPERTPYDWYKVGGDRLNYPVAHIVRMEAEALQVGHPGSRIFFLSGRDAVCRSETQGWLDLMLPLPVKTELLMRPQGDYRKDSVVKQELYEQNVKGLYNVLYVLDDRQQVVDMWRDQGLTCLQVAKGDF